MFKSAQVLNKPAKTGNERFLKNQRDRLRAVPTETVFQKFNLNLSHLDDQMEKSKNHKCQMCGKMFSKKTSMRLHQTKRHFLTREFLLFI